MTALIAVVGGLLAGAGLGALLAGADAPPGRVAAGDRNRAGSAHRRWLLRVLRGLGPLASRWVPTPTDADRRIAAAGLAPTLRPSDLRAARGAGAVVGLALAAVLLPIAGAGGAGLIAAVPVGLALAPDLLLRRRTARRRRALQRGLPDVVDLLRIVLRGGRSVPETLARVGAHHHGLLGEELRRAAAQVRLGVETEAALVAFQRRCPADGIPELVALLRRAHHGGATVASGLAALADDLRDRRARAAIDRAARAAPKIQLVVALLLVPAVMLLIAAALLQLRGVA